MSSSRTKLLDAGLALMGEGGPRAVTIRAAEARAAMPHGSIRHHFGDRHAFVVALVGHAAEVEGAALEGRDAAEAVRHIVGPGRVVALARYELALLAVRDPEVRAAYLAAREGFVQRLGGGAAGRRLVASVDGLILDALIRGDVDAEAILGAISGSGTAGGPGR